MPRDSEVQDFLRALDKRSKKPDTLIQRGTVTAVDGDNVTVDVRLSGTTTPSEDVRYLDSYLTPAEGDDVLVISLAGHKVVLGRFAS